MSQDININKDNTYTIQNLMFKVRRTLYYLTYRMLDKLLDLPNS